MIRFYLSDVVGDGTELNEYRPLIADYAVNMICEIVGNKALVLVNHASAVSAAGVDEFPSLPTDNMTAWNAVLSSRGFGYVANAGDTVQDIAGALGAELNPNFSLINFSVSD